MIEWKVADRELKRRSNVRWKKSSSATWKSGEFNSFIIDSDNNMSLI
jgi:hypothetical protein